jgi:DNA-binding LytR/AlgR family response regulator
MYKVLIVEDSLLQAKALCKIFVDQGIDDVVIEKTGAGAIKQLEKNNIDFAFLDIQLADELTGVDVAMYIETHRALPYIFLTSNIGKENQYFAEIAKNPAVQYLPKGNWLPEQVMHFVDLAFYKFSLQQGNADDANNMRTVVSDGIFVKENGRRFKVMFSDIQYMQAKDDYIKIHYAQGKHLLYRSSIKGILKILDNQMFVQIHQSTVVNRQAVKEFHFANKLVLLQNDVRLNMSRTYKDVLSNIFR